MASWNIVTNSAIISGDRKYMLNWYTRRILSMTPDDADMVDVSADGNVRRILASRARALSECGP